ncbi:kynureninase [Thermonema lapsum]|uniref:Kynureninase n=1 Tax=Thermonema lapsum TaxID=28195 RepID=A0A846MTT1_9BACT|nr:kynureninase [Thermonema lapsum]NIK74637.1 kynureninase [Thermonema lapsum]
MVHTISSITMEDSLDFARQMDKQDPLYQFRNEFHIPRRNGQEVIYLCGNSLGLQPKRTAQTIDQEMERWRTLAVDGHFEGATRWFDYHKALQPMLAPIVGAHPDEITVMNNLTSNLHFMMVSFYRPQGKRFKVLMEAGAFPSDQYAVETQVRFHGYHPEEAIVEVAPREGETSLRTEDIEAAIYREGDQLALVLFGGINYYTGQVFDMARIAAAARQVGANVGFDLAHAVGNVPLRLHDWEVDFAVWCSYKYLNSGPGGVGGAFVHRKHHHAHLPRFGGWWGHNEEERFLMKKGFKPITTAEGWQVANEPILLMAAHKAALEVFQEAGFERLREKSKLLTDYLLFFIDNYCSDNIQVLTPRNYEARGCQVSIYVQRNGKEVFDALQAAHIVGDWREPNVIRLAPVPLYNTFEEVYRVGQVLKQF